MHPINTFRLTSVLLLCYITCILIKIWTPHSILFHLGAVMSRTLRLSRGIKSGGMNQKKRELKNFKKVTRVKLDIDQAPKTSPNAMGSRNFNSNKLPRKTRWQPIAEKKRKIFQNKKFWKWERVKRRNGNMV